MHKKLEAELVSIAHSILQMKNREDVTALQEKARQLYEKLSVLNYVDTYINTTPNAIETKEELVSKIENATLNEVTEKPLLDNNVLDDKIEKEPVIIRQLEEVVEEKIEGSITIEVEEAVKEKIVDEIVLKDNPKKQLSLDEEFKDSVSVDVTADLFKKVEKKDTEVKTSLNDRLMQNNLQVGLNDRIAFVKHLFNHSQADFNRVLSQLNSFKSEKEAKDFISNMVKPDYDWAGKEEYEERLVALIERRFA
ncbi:hypothetical protein [Urechidicola croceus]|uniref:Uncharacterized protein n=1 Tax=Urechidicola croceus TaxID=1850246 RepID=A0A1D8P9Y2_9FLAO|nr:hypothetical protein [Urechidicola croceus]AOW21384.1 hypothetical protein LPB138_12150 [Urechidicola croceus]